MWWFSKKAREDRARKKWEASLLHVGPSQALDTWEKEARAQFIENAVSRVNVPLETAVRLADSWEILETRQQIGDDPVETVFVPCPVWDTEWAFRPGFKTREEAIAEVIRYGAQVMEDSDDSE